MKCCQRVGLFCALQPWQACAESVCKLQLVAVCRLPCQQRKYSVTKCGEPGYWILLVPRKLQFTSEGIHQVTREIHQRKQIAFSGIYVIIQQNLHEWSRASILISPVCSNAAGVFAYRSAQNKPCAASRARALLVGENNSCF